jgi:hypothetical protein
MFMTHVRISTVIERGGNSHIAESNEVHLTLAENESESITLTELNTALRMAVFPDMVYQLQALGNLTTTTPYLPSLSRVYLPKDDVGRNVTLSTHFIEIVERSLSKSDLGKSLRLESLLEEKPEMGLVQDENAHSVSFTFEATAFNRTSYHYWSENPEVVIHVHLTKLSTNAEIAPHMNILSNKIEQMLPKDAVVAIVKLQKGKLTVAPFSTFGEALHSDLIEPNRYFIKGDKDGGYYLGGVEEDFESWEEFDNIMCTLGIHRVNIPSYIEAIIDFREKCLFDEVDGDPSNPDCPDKEQICRAIWQPLVEQYADNL